MEESDQASVQALASAGANKLQQTFHASIPLVVPQFVGLLINQAINSFQFVQMLTHIIVVLVLIVVVDQASALIRRRLA